MYRECFLYSEEKISSKPEPNMLYLHSNDSEIFVCKHIPFFAYFKIPIQFQHEWIFYVNDKPITININTSISVPFYKLQDLLLTKKCGIESTSSTKEISRALYKYLDKWFNTEKSISDEDIVIFFKIISTNFPFNHFSSAYNKMHPIIKQESFLNDAPNQIEITFKKFLLAVRPNGKPNPQPLFNFTTSFLMFFHQLKYSDFFISHQNFIANGIHYILEYLHNDNEWGPYSVISFLSRQLEINRIQSYPLNNYNIDQNPDFFFDKKNLKCVEECASIFGKISLLWCYNPCFHNDFINIVKKIFGKRGKKIKQKDLFNIILSRIYHEKDDELVNESVNDYFSFYKFVQIISPETDNKQIFFEIYKIFCSNEFEKTKMIPFKFKLFYESEIKCQMSKRSEKLPWLNLLEEQKQIKLNQDLMDTFFDEDTNSNHHEIQYLHFSDEDDDFEQKNEDIFDFGKSDHILSPSRFENEIDDISNKNLNVHHAILSTSLLNSEICLKKSSTGNDKFFEIFEDWPIMKERFNKTEVKFIKHPQLQNEENSSIMPFNFIQNTSMKSIFDENQDNSKSISKSSNLNQNRQKPQKESKIAYNSREKTSSII